MPATPAPSTPLATAALWLMPLFFTSNLVIGRAAVTTVDPYTLAFLRWAGALLILLPLVAPQVKAHAGAIRAQGKLLLLLGFLAMWICGAGVYLALKHTTASNATLIYTSSPVFILLLEALFRGRRIRVLETLGIVLALAGIATIVLKGSLAQLVSMRFNPGDLMVLAAAVSWAVYSVLIRREGLKTLPTTVLFVTVAAAGLVVLAPFTAHEIWVSGRFPHALAQWQAIAGLSLFSSVLAFLSYQYALKIKGPVIAGVFMYLMPPYGVLLAVLFLGETLEPYHFAGFALVLGGLVLATAPLPALWVKLAGRRAAA